MQVRTLKPDPPYVRKLSRILRCRKALSMRYWGVLEPECTVHCQNKRTRCRAMHTNMLFLGRATNLCCTRTLAEDPKYVKGSSIVFICKTHILVLIGSRIGHAIFPVAAGPTLYWQILQCRENFSFKYGGLPGN